MKPDSPKRKAVPVLVPMPADRPYSYAVPEGETAVAGAIVRVPLGPREVAGVVWDGAAEAVDARKLRPISQIFDCPPIDEPTRRFVDWVAAYTLSPPGMVARMLLRAPEAFDPGAARRGHRHDRPGAGPRDAGARARAGTRRRRPRLDALGPRPCRRRVADRGRRAEGAGRVRDGAHPAPARGRRCPTPTTPSPNSRPTSAVPRMRCARAPKRAASASPWSTASPARARPKSISRPSPPRCAPAGRC